MHGLPQSQLITAVDVRCHGSKHHSYVRDVGCDCKKNVTDLDFHFDHK